MAPDMLLPWHRDAWSQVTAQQHNGRLAHAYLINGPVGSGRYQFAHGLAAKLFCEQGTEDPVAMACGQCRQCRLFDSGNHPDVHDISPEEGRSIKIDQIRSITRLVNQTSNQTGAIKVIIINPAEALGNAAANSLLKNLEEPPGRTLFLLISEPGAQMLPTIRSRCQPLPLVAASTEQAMVWLTQHSAAAPEELSAALALAPGAPLQALKLLEAGVPAWRSIVHDQLAEMAAGRISALEVAKYCNAQPPDYAIQLMQMLSLQKTRDALLAQDSERAKMLLRYARDLIGVKKQLDSGANPNPLMALEHIFSAWQTTTGDMDVTRQGSGERFADASRSP